MGHGQQRPFFGRQSGLGADGDGVAGPEVAEVEERFTALQQDLVAAAPGVFRRLGMMDDDGAVLMTGGLDP